MVLEKLSKKEKTTLFLIVGIVLVFKFLLTDTLVQLETASIFGSVTGLGISLGVLLILVGAVLIIIPEPTTTITGVGILIGGLVLGFGSFLEFMEGLFGGSSTLASIGFFGFFGFLVFKRILR